MPSILSLSLQPRYWELMQSGIKTIEGRICKPKYQQLSLGQTLQFCQANHPSLCFYAKITSLRTYPSFLMLLQKEGLHHCLPGVCNEQEGVSIYHSFPNYQKEESLYGVIAIGVHVAKDPAKF